MQNAISNDPLSAPMLEENLTPLYPPVHIVNNPMPISSNPSESVGNNPNVIYPLGNVRPNFNTKAHGNAPSTSDASLNNSINGKDPKSNNGNAPNNKGNAPLPLP